MARKRNRPVDELVDLAVALFHRGYHATSIREIKHDRRTGHVAADMEPTQAAKALLALFLGQRTLARTGALEPDHTAAARCAPCFRLSG